MRVIFSDPSLKRLGTYVVFTSDGKKLSSGAADLDPETLDVVKSALNTSQFKGEKGKYLEVFTPPKSRAEKIIVVGIGKLQNIDELAAQSIGGSIFQALSSSSSRAGYVLLDEIKGRKISNSKLTAHIAYGCMLRSYRFDKYKTQEKREVKKSLVSVTMMLKDSSTARGLFSPLKSVLEGVFFTRDLVTEPANVIFPISFLARLQVLKKLGVKLEVLDEKQMKKLGMGALLGVAQGSAHKPRLVAMRWDGAPKSKDKRPIAFVGKGVTFDTGGISIKPSGGMEDMKWDMGGAGVVAGLLYALAARKAKVNAVGVVGLVENMPSSTAQRPGDVVKTMSGKTIEVINTDAEGRLVLADALWWTQKKFKPHTVIDLATLTGAIIVALGYHYAGMFTNNDQLGKKLSLAGEITGEGVWHMPLGDSYDKQVRSQIADMKNVGGRDAGSITAAQILQRFINKDIAWAHLDIAGVTWAQSASATVPKGGTGFGVRLLNKLVEEHFEQ
ncbi:MAG: leucyl aminopeptidase [Rhodospirillaceae bacterium]|nr:leucyl aminopeptidase [Rhodospirillaceae bacterium]